MLAQTNPLILRLFSKDFRKMQTTIKVLALDWPFARPFVNFMIFQFLITIMKANTALL